MFLKNTGKKSQQKLDQPAPILMELIAQKIAQITNENKDLGFEDAMKEAVKGDSLKKFDWAEPKNVSFIKEHLTQILCGSKGEEKEEVKEEAKEEPKTPKGKPKKGAKQQTLFGRKKKGEEKKEIKEEKAEEKAEKPKEKKGKEKKGKKHRFARPLQVAYNGPKEAVVPVETDDGVIIEAQKGVTDLDVQCPGKSKGVQIDGNHVGCEF
jgi:hypothetical protein